MSNAKSKLKSFGNGLLNGLVLAADLGNMTRMTEIERQIDELQKEYAELNDRLDSAHKRRVPYTA